MSENQIAQWEITQFSYMPCEYCEIILNAVFKDAISKNLLDNPTGIDIIFPFSINNIASLVSENMTKKTAIRHIHDLINIGIFSEYVLLKSPKIRYKYNSEPKKLLVEIKDITPDCFLSYSAYERFLERLKNIRRKRILMLNDDASPSEITITIKITYKDGSEELINSEQP